MAINMALLAIIAIICAILVLVVRVVVCENGNSAESCALLPEMDETCGLV